MSVTTALTFEKIGAHAGEVIGQTRTSPSRTAAISLDVDHDPRGALDDARRRRRAREPRLRPPRRCAHSWTRCVVTPQSMIDIGSVIASGVAPIAGGGVQLGEPLEQLLAPRDDRRPVRRAERRAAGRPGEEQLVERRRDLVAPELEDVLGVLEEAVLREQRAELAHLVPPARQEPVVAVELVLLDVREDHPREPEQLVERRARLLVEQRAVLLARAGRARGRAPRSGARPPRPPCSARTWPTTDAYGMLGSSYQLR